MIMMQNEIADKRDRAEKEERKQVNALYLNDLRGDIERKTAMQAAVRQQKEADLNA